MVGTISDRGPGPRPGDGGGGPSTAGAAIDILDVTQGFVQNGEPLPVLDHVSLSARPGEFVALVGPSGCGKSTLLRLVAGLDVPLSGEVYVDGRGVEGPGPRRGLAFQDPTLLPWLTVRQNVALGPQARGRLKQYASKVDEILDLVGLRDFADALPAQLSGGMAQRVSLARVLVNEPDVFLFDEPFGKLDALTRRTMQREVERLWRDVGFTALLVTHDVDEAVYLADRIIVFSPRPARVVRVVEVRQPRPRDHDASQFLATRELILSILDPEGARRQA